MTGPGPLVFLLLALLVLCGNKAVAASPGFSWCADATRIRQMLCQSPDFRSFSPSENTGAAEAIEPSQIVTPADAPRGYREQIMILE